MFLVLFLGFLYELAVVHHRRRAPRKINVQHSLPVDLTLLLLDFLRFSRGFGSLLLGKPQVVGLPVPIALVVQHLGTLGCVPVIGDEGCCACHSLQEVRIVHLHRALGVDHVTTEGARALTLLRADNSPTLGAVVHQWVPGRLAEAAHPAGDKASFLELLDHLRLLVGRLVRRLLGRLLVVSSVLFHHLKLSGQLLVVARVRRGLLVVGARRRGGRLTESHLHRWGRRGSRRRNVLSLALSIPSEELIHKTYH
mmetsp:Transcript_9929/g.21825  ORF Transcript_9929/g.21825 Transcript_9929/m.21825 type:complete len:253 (-) Transcript_9929:230-988(-)